MSPRRVLLSVTEVLPQGDKTKEFWSKVREVLVNKPHGELVKVATYNHPTLAYRAKRDINSGLNPIFPEPRQWVAIVIKDEQSGFYGPRSKRLTYRHELFMAYTPTGG